MEYTQLFASLVIAVIGLFALMSLGADINSIQDTTLGADINGTYTAVNALAQTDLTTISTSAGVAGAAQEGQSLSTDEAGLGQRALQIITLIPRLLGLPMVMIHDAAGVFNIPSIIVDLGISLLVFAFMMTFGYLLLLGVRRVTGI